MFLCFLVARLLVAVRNLSERVLELMFRGGSFDTLTLQMYLQTNVKDTNSLGQAVATHVKRNLSTIKELVDRWQNKCIPFSNLTSTF